ncbi:hypothetical protein [uncultured Cyclobacterium sp.]|uniref:hypothetical protein n=1 Tax=uncultured Cyclobacterium sp. TaxID=453820 RepID=UPI0030EF6AEF|tara:strand:+ start:440466 stop:440687 length:222 start_codon:yes stop_codon:yes gene_type:complete
MQLLVTLFIFTICYGLLFLSIFPVKPLQKISDFTHKTKKAMYKQYDLTWPYFFSFLGGYVVASAMVYLIQDSI